MNAFPLNFLLFFGICMLVSAIGFKNYVWFISLGYGFSIAAEGIAMFVLYGQGLTLGTILLALLFVIYGCRLGGYLAYREFKVSTYNTNMKGEIKEGKDVPMGAVSAGTGKLNLTKGCECMKKLMVFVLSFILVLCLGGCSNETTSIGIIGGADGPTAIFVTSNINWLHVCGLTGVMAVTILVALIIYRNKKK